VNCQEGHKYASTVLDQSNIYDNRGVPVVGGALDPRMGPTDNVSLCQTCLKTKGNCYGHEAIINLAAPILQPGLRMLFKKFIKGYCMTCKAFTAGPSKTAKINCSTCCKAIKYTFLAPYILENTETKVALSLRSVYNHLKELPVEERTKLCSYMDPLNFFMIDLIVPSTSLRYSVKVNNKTIIDDLTTKIQTIIGYNEKLKEYIQNEYQQVNTKEIYNLLSYEIFTFMDNKIPSLPISTSRNGRVLKSLLEKLSSKEGLLRSHLRGKRTNYSGRFVITADPSLNINEVGIPQKIADKFITTVPVTVNNIDMVKSWFRPQGNVKVMYYYHKTDGGDVLKFRITENLKERILETIRIGDNVQRALATGDIVALNRPPTIHKYNILAHRVVVYKDNEQEGATLRIHPNITAPYNADFDGDEFHLYNTTSYKAEFDLKVLMFVDSNIIDSKNSTPLIGIQKELLSAAYNLSSKNPTFNKSEALEILKGDFDITKLGQETFTGRQLISMCIPKGFNHNGTQIKIVDGQFIQGVFTKSNFSKNSLFTKKLVAYTNPEYVKVLTKFIHLFSNYYKYVGHTICMRDYILDAEPQKKCQLLKESALNSIHTENLEGAQIDKLMKDYQIKVYNVVQKQLQLKKENNTWAQSIQMAHAGASGTYANLSQIYGSVGQRLVYGTVPYDYFKGNYAKEGNQKIKEKLDQRGWITGNYSRGLEPRQFINDCSTARESTWMSNIKTTQTGYFSRKISSGVSDISIDRNHQVVDSKGSIIQTKFGGNGTNSTYYSPNLEETILKGKISSNFYRTSDQEGTYTVDDLMDYCNKRGIDKNTCKIILKNSSPTKKFTQDELKGIFRSILLPVGLPLGMSLSHAMTEPIMQLTLSSKHHLDSDQTFKRYEEIVLSTKTNHSLILKCNPDVSTEFMDKLLEELLPVRVENCYKTEINAGKGSMDMELGPEYNLSIMPLVEQHILNFFGGLNDIMEGSIRLSVEDRKLSIALIDESNLGLLTKLFAHLKNMVVQGHACIKTHYVNTETKGIKLIGDKKAALYKVIPAFINTNYKNEIQIQYKDPIYVSSIHGIEHAKKLLYKELSMFVKSGLKIDQRYLSLFADLVSTTGQLLSISRDGLIARKEPLTKCAFEATKSLVYKIALTKEKDYLRSPYSTLMMGQALPIGAHYYDVSY